MFDWVIGGLGDLFGFGLNAIGEAVGWAWDKVVTGIYTWLANGLALLVEWGGGHVLISLWCRNCGSGCCSGRSTKRGECNGRRRTGASVACWPPCYRLNPEQGQMQKASYGFAGQSRFDRRCDTLTPVFRLRPRRAVELRAASAC